MQRAGEGIVLYEPASPAGLTYQKDGAEQVRGFAREAAASAKIAWSESQALALRRGPYVIAAGLDEPQPGGPAILSGRFVDLFDAQLAVASKVKLTPGRRALLLDLDAATRAGPGPRIVAAACRVREEAANSGRVSIRTEGVADTNGVVLLLTTDAPKEVRINDQPAPESAFDFHDGTLRIRFPNSPEGTRIEIDFRN